MIPASVADFLTAHALRALEFEAGSTATAPAAAARLGVAVGQIAKSMLFKGKDGFFRLVVAAGDTRIDNGQLKKALGCKHRLATAEETLAVTGLRPGGVCPFGLAEKGVALFLDESLFVHDLVFPAAGTDASGVPITPQRLAEVTGGTRVQLTSC
jgi:prolyl-tRNA editing enzyme YbaK/EbsC (Cys-tRNA(Pro) deacylase)